MGSLPLLLSREPIGALPDLETRGDLDSEQLLHLARRRRPLLVLVQADDDELSHALGRLPQPPTILRGPAPEPSTLRQAVARALALRSGRERLARLLAGRIADDPEELSDRLLALASGGDAPLVVRGSSTEHRTATSRALHDLRPNPRADLGPFVSLDASRPEERALIAEFLDGPLPPLPAATLHVEGLGEQAPDLARRLAEALRSGAIDGVRWTFGRPASSAELPAELECRTLSLEGVSDPLESEPTGPLEPRRLDELEREHVLRVLDECQGNKSRTAVRLGIHRSTLHTKLRAWGLAGTDGPKACRASRQTGPTG